ncbi:hypothetical protein L21SP3_01590 [Sedimentisphaera cyanobacteriorum]|uniref:Uncharacterized protein n=1 Tax=Sedimentisphaera cyanobacteriorum TaxID=1940790 RepID=A0A1Q2HQP9_9BACT|nr:hypothetical protein [Sedimentisphaera cyanobacteriorum]AQQ09777.1 hypothetical protein L21SP3_01590 [Sedimentisphaera cyanobacteriorum]
MEKKNQNIPPEGGSLPAEELKAENERLKFEKEAAKSLAESGIIDLDAGLALCREKQKQNPEKKPEELVSGLKEKKAYLFRSRPAELRSNIAQAAEQTENQLEGAARKAAQTGRPAEVSEYMRVRREKTENTNY